MNAISTGPMIEDAARIPARIATALAIMSSRRANGDMPAAVFPFTPLI
jgi:hypothetical protein